MIENRCWSN